MQPLKQLIRPFLITSTTVSTTAWAYDTWWGGNLINRTSRAAYASLATVIEYKIILSQTNIEPAALHRRVAERWLWVVQRNGGLYTKLAQGVASMNHVLPPEYLQVLQVIQDHAPTVPYEEIETLFKEEFNGRSPMQVFKEFDKEAIASASIAQVHQATLFDGTKVAVKIQKPQVAKQIAADLWSYRVMTAAIEFAFDLPITWMVPYTCEQLKKETDFTVEANNGRRALQMMDPTLKDIVTIPKIYDDLSSKRVLTCEWIDGVRVTDVVGIQKLGLSTKQVMDVVCRFFSHQLFVTGHLHADPHPGNILIRTQPQQHTTTTNKNLNVVVIDHGLYCDMPPQFRKNYAQLWVAIVDGDIDSMRRISAEWGIRDHELFASFQLLRPYKNRGVRVGVQAGTASTLSGKVTKAEVLEMQQLVKERIKKMLQDSSLTPPELSLVGRNLNLVRSLNKGLGSPINRPRIMAGYAHLGVQDHVTNSSMAMLVWEMKMWLIDVMFWATETWRAVVKRVAGKETGGFEDLMEKQVAVSVEEKLGFKINLTDDSIG